MGTQETTSATPAAKATEKLDVHIALDGTEHSKVVIDNLHYFVSPAQTTCDFVFVHPTPKAHDKKFVKLDEEAEENARHIVNVMFDDFANTLARQQFTVDGRHMLENRGTVEETLIDFTDDHPKDMLVVGMHQGATKRKGWRLSSTSYAIATHAEASVLVLKKPPKKDGQLKVLFATDGSKLADKALEDMLRFLPKGNTSILVFNVVPVNYYVLPVVEPYVNYGPLEKAMQGEANELLERTKKQIIDRGFHVENAYFAIGDPVDQILEEAEKQGVDLIAMGSHGHGGKLSRWLLGSVSSKVLEYAQPSVAILK